MRYCAAAASAVDTAIDIDIDAAISLYDAIIDERYT